MSAQPASPAVRRAGWSGAARLAPLLDPAIAVVAVVLSLVALLDADLAAIDPRLEDANALAVAATVVAAGSLAWRRSRPVASYAAMIAGCLVVSLSGHYIGRLSVLLLVSLFSLAVYGRRPAGLVGLAVGATCFAGLAVLDVPDLGTSVLLQSLALLVAAWALGDAVRSRRRQQRDQQLELVETAVTAERLRIARELHDVVAHSMSLIAVQAGVGAHVIRTDPEAAEQSLVIIADTSRRALDQIRSMLGLLRESPDDGTRPPAQGLADLAALVDDVRAAGLDVVLTAPAAYPELDAVTSLAGYRIVQESLTNVLKHSAARTAEVTVVTRADVVSLEVTDPGPERPDAPSGTGHGLLGLRERARLLGGTLDAAPDRGGFRVHAVLPIGVGR